MLRRPSLRSQLNQIRLWVRQGRTDAWIAHKLDISVEQLSVFKREQGLNGEPAPEPEEILEPVAPAEEPPEPVEEPPEPVEELDIEPEPAAEEQEDAEPGRRRRRGRRGGRRRGGRRLDSYEATFEHGGEGYGLWLDPAVADSPLYTEHWAGHRAVVVTVEADAITIRRAEGDDEDEDGE